MYKHVLINMYKNVLVANKQIYILWIYKDVLVNSGANGDTLSL